MIQPNSLPIAHTSEVNSRLFKSRQEEASARETEILQLIAKGVSNSGRHHVEVSKATSVPTWSISTEAEVSNQVEAVTEGLRKALAQM